MIRKSLGMNGDGPIMLIKGKMLLLKSVPQHSKDVVRFEGDNSMF